MLEIPNSCDGPIWPNHTANLCACQPNADTCTLCTRRDLSARGTRRSVFALRVCHVAAAHGRMNYCFPPTPVLMECALGWLIYIWFQNTVACVCSCVNVAAACVGNRSSNAPFFGTHGMRDGDSVCAFVCVEHTSQPCTRHALHMRFS